MFFPSNRADFSYLEVTITGERLQILTYAQYLWPMSSEVFFSMPHLLWHRTSVYNDHIRGPVIVAHIAERLAVELSLTVLTTRACLSFRDSSTQLSACGANALTDCTTAAATQHVNVKLTNNTNIIFNACKYIPYHRSDKYKNVTTELYKYLLSFPFCYCNWIIMILNTLFVFMVKTS